MGSVRAPASLVVGGRGRRFWRQTTGSFELSEAELVLLEETCRTLDTLDRLQEQVVVLGPMVAGSAGQPVVNPALTEARGQRAILHRLLAALRLPDDDGETVPTAASLRAVTAAGERWRGHVKGL